MNNGNFWLKDGKRSVGGSGPLGWAAIAFVGILLYAYAPPFQAAVNNIVTFLVGATLLVGLVALLVIAANSKPRGRW